MADSPQVIPTKEDREAAEELLFDWNRMDFGAGFVSPHRLTSEELTGVFALYLAALRVSKSEREAAQEKLKKIEEAASWAVQCLGPKAIDGVKDETIAKRVREVIPPLANVLAEHQEGRKTVVDTDWQPMTTAPKNATEVRVRMADGTVHEHAHWASDLSGEEQPPFRGWFIPVLRADGSVSYHAGITEPVAWAPLQRMETQK